MRVRHRRWIWILPLLLPSVLLTVLSCAPAQAGPRAWIDWPLDGFETGAGATVTLIAHAYAEEGVAEVRLEVDRRPYRVVSPDPAGGQFAEVSVEWFAGEPGIYLLSVIAFDANGQASNPANVTVSVAGEGPEPTITPGPEETPPPSTPTPEEPVATMVPTETLSPPAATSSPPTRTPVPPTATPPPAPPTIVSFTANPSTVVAGECSKLSWAVEGLISAVYLDGEGARDHDSRDRCPDVTTTYTLRAVGPGGETTDSRAVQVIQPSPTPRDTEGPLIQNETGPQQMWAPDGSSCRDDEPYQFQANVSDPSGVLSVKLVYSINQGPDQSGGLQLVSGTTYRLGYALPNLQGAGGTFRWHIAACDKVNQMNCRDSGTHNISMLDCPI